MSKHYGVLCHGCKNPLILADADELSPNQVEFFTVPLTEVTCPYVGCRKVDLYGSDEGFLFEVKPTPIDTAQ
jgi:hypothetical protein